MTFHNSVVKKENRTLSTALSKMDVAAFSDDNFDVYNWINTTYKNSESGSQNKDQFVQSFVTKLQLYVQQVNSAVEDTSQQFLLNLPRVVKDTQNLQNEALALRKRMSNVQQEIAQVQEETGSCMENLEKLDKLKTTLQVAKQGLQESDGWGRLTSELEEFLEQNDLVKACDKLHSLQKSLAAQIGLPGQNEREIQVEGYKNRVEALASPSVVQNFSSGDIEQSRKYVKLFENMDRLAQLSQYYRQVQKNILERHWIEITELAENSSSNRFLRDFYEVLLEHYQKQSKWCAQVFGVQGYIEPILILSEVLNSVQPNRETSVMTALKRTNDKITALVEISNANVYMGALMAKNLELANFKLTQNQLKNLARSIYDFFNIFIGQYASIEQNNLNTNMANLNINYSTVAESIRALSSSNGKIFQWAEIAIKKCEEITQNCAIAQLVLVLNTFFKNYMEKYKKAQKQLRASRSTEQDWSLLQTCISLLNCVGDFEINLDTLEKKLTETIASTNDRFNQQQETDFSYRISGKRELHEFLKLIDTANDYKKNSYLPNSNCGIFNTVHELIKPLCEEIHDITLASIFTPMENHLKHIELNETFNSSGAVDLPDYSYAPQEYITQVGQYLLTLPQHLEPLLLAPSSQLKLALELCDEKYSRNIPCADVLLSLIADECCAMFQEQIVQICEISSADAKQIATDIEYLGSVLDELGLSLNSHLQQMAALLRSPAENYLQLSVGCDPKLVTAIRQMRNIISSSD